jgi:hypothetical protein
MAADAMKALTAGTKEDRNPARNVKLAATTVKQPPKQLKGNGN